MEALVVRDGATQADPVPVCDLRSTVAALPDGRVGLGRRPSTRTRRRSGRSSGSWISTISPIEDVRHRNQRPKLDLYPGHVFAVFRPLALGADGLVGSELFVFASPRFLVTLRFAPAFDLGEGEAALADRVHPRTRHGLRPLRDRG